MVLREQKIPLDASGEPSIKYKQCASEELRSLATRLDEESIEKATDPSSSGNSNAQIEPLDPCDDCKTVHLPKRIVCCVDGTWMGSDGVAGNESGNASNIFRIWASVKEGIVQDVHGKKRLQLRKYFKGVGTDLELTAIPRLYAGITGSGCEDLISRVYKFCAFNCCPSRDEIYFFGYSRGAYVVRAVAALFHHLRTINPKSEEFDKSYNESLHTYHQSRSKKGVGKHDHETFRHTQTNTLAAAPIRFIGVIDTVKAFNDAGLYDISQTPNIANIRHALAILERRKAFSPEKFINLDSPRQIDTTRETSDHSGTQARPTCTETWFLGSHANLGGSLPQDGLSLWPLQYLLSEAQETGLVLEFQSLVSIEIQNPLEYSMPQDPEKFQSITYKNGLTVSMWDLEAIFASPGFNASVNITASVLGSLLEEERQISGLEKGSSDCPVNTIIHPSVYYHDDCTEMGLLHINKLDGRNRIRKYIQNIKISRDELFWNIPFRQRFDLALGNLRVLVCGGQGAGKSTVINLVADQELATVNPDIEATYHNIYQELPAQAEDKKFVFHDSQGWNSGSDAQFSIVSEFLENRRRQSDFSEQLHCIWYCIKYSQNRIEAVDRRFFDEVNSEGVTIILVFTNCDTLQDSCYVDAIRQYEKEKGNLRRTGGVKEVPQELYPDISCRLDQIYKEKKRSIARNFLSSLGKDLPYVFVAKDGSEGFKKSEYQDHIQDLDNLVSQTESARRSPALRKIHNQAVGSRISEILPIVCDEAAKVIPRPGRYGAFEVEIPNYFGLSVAPNSYFENLSDIFAETRNMRNGVIRRSDSSIPLIYGPKLLGMASAATAFFYEVLPMLYLGPATSAVGVVAVYAEARSKFYRTKAILVELAFLILVYDRLVWFGYPDIERDMMARAWIRALSCAPDIEEKVQNDLSIWGSNDLEGLLLGVVQRFRFVGDNMDAEPGGQEAPS
ncbi:hypothetical protein TWF225_009287 [Orbilia oligospora]|nr:hypothetical protein TWF225_009287 [Orbilia oligospora]KAF3269928.1 hypothetical protein TWF217_008271 [Orbilia oligospora]KAF3270388.1 hypothetical protein TWF128_004162 [Orbilia oligospora]KAF3298124.1 hypothetical protein TWF132_004265 [Orbilia oligospora]